MFALLVILDWYFQLVSNEYPQSSSVPMSDQDQDKNITSRTYWFTLGLGLVYIILLGLFTYLFNHPV